jgi:hypothetical protein
VRQEGCFQRNLNHDFGDRAADNRNDQPRSGRPPFLPQGHQQQRIQHARQAAVVFQLGKRGKQQDADANHACDQSGPQKPPRADLDQRAQHCKAQAIPQQVLHVGMHEVPGYDTPDLTRHDVPGTEIEKAFVLQKPMKARCYQQKAKGENRKSTVCHDNAPEKRAARRLPG